MKEIIRPKPKLGSLSIYDSNKGSFLIRISDLCIGLYGEFDTAVLYFSNKIMEINSVSSLDEGVWFEK